MESIHETHVDLVRLLGATDHLLTSGEPSADGSWEHWPRFLEFLKNLELLQTELQSRLREGLRNTDSRQRACRRPPTAEDLAGYDRRLEVLRRRRDDLSAAEEADTPASPRISTSGVPSESPGSGEGVKSLAISPNDEATHSKKTPGIGRIEWRDSSVRAAGRTRRGSGGVGSGSRPSGRSPGQGEDAAQADEVAHEIASMAGKLKESSMAINQTLRTQTKVLEDTGDAVAENVGRVKQENDRVSERLRKKRAAMVASWCMMFTVLVTFFATYALVIVPFEKRRGPFARPRVSAFASAAEVTAAVPAQDDEGLEGVKEIEIDPLPELRTRGVERDLDLHKKKIEEKRRHAARAYEERARVEKRMQDSANEGMRFATEEKEKYRKRQAEGMMENARERRDAKHEARARARAMAAEGRLSPRDIEELDGFPEDDEMRRHQVHEAYLERSRMMRDKEEMMNSNMGRMSEEHQKFRDIQAKMLDPETRMKIKEETRARKEALKRARAELDGAGDEF